MLEKTHSLSLQSSPGFQKNNVPVSARARKATDRERIQALQQSLEQRASRRGSASRTEAKNEAAQKIQRAFRKYLDKCDLGSDRENE